MKKFLLVLVFLFAFISTSCSSLLTTKTDWDDWIATKGGYKGIRIIHHPDYNFPLTDWHYVSIYREGFEPTYPYIIIAKLEMRSRLHRGWIQSKDAEMRKAAAVAGGDGILITTKDVNMQEYNQLVTRGSISSYTGFCGLKGLNVTSYTETTSIEKGPTYIWVIKRVQQ